MIEVVFYFFVFLGLLEIDCFIGLKCGLYFILYGKYFLVVDLYFFIGWNLDDDFYFLVFYGIVYWEGIVWMNF